MDGRFLNLASLDDRKGKLMKAAKINVVVSGGAARQVRALPPAVQDAVMRAIAAHRDVPGALMPILHGVQDTLGYVPPDSLNVIAHELNLSRAEVHGVVTFYHHFRSAPPGRHVVQICRAEACQALGARALEAHAKKSLGIDFHETTSDGAITLEPVYCLGNCGCGPSLLIDTDELHGRVTPQAFDDLVKTARMAGMQSNKSVALSATPTPPPLRSGGGQEEGAARMQSNNSVALGATPTPPPLRSGGGQEEGAP
jgi:formate dehydrogenase subunit gamma